MSKTRSYYTIEESDGQMIDIEATPIPTPEEERSASNFETMANLDPATGANIDRKHLETQLDGLGLLELAAKRKDCSPWFLQHQLNELRDEWYDRAPIEGLPRARVKSSTREMANERKERIKELQRTIDQRKAEWTLRDPKRLGQVKRGKVNSAPDNAISTKEQRRKILRLDETGIKEQWRAAQRKGWIKAPNKSSDPWDDGATWTKTGRRGGNGSSQLAFFLGLLYGGDSIEYDPREERKIIKQGKPIDIEILREASKIFRLKQSTISNIRYKQEGTSGKHYLDIFEEMQEAKFKAYHPIER